MKEPQETILDIAGVPLFADEREKEKVKDSEMQLKHMLGNIDKDYEPYAAILCKEGFYNAKEVAAASVEKLKSLGIHFGAALRIHREFKIVQVESLLQAAYTFGVCLDIQRKISKRRLLELFEIAEQEKDLEQAFKFLVDGEISSSGALQTPKEASLSKFCRDVQEPTVRAQLLKLEAGDVLRLRDSVWLDLSTDASNELYIRECYPQILKVAKEYQARHFEDSENGTVTITGSSGTGKSHLGAIIVGQAIIEGRDVLFEERSSAYAMTQYSYKYHLSTKGARELDRKDSISVLRGGLEAYKKDPKNNLKPLYLVDGGARTISPNNYIGPTYVLASPHSELHRLDLKARPHVMLSLPPCPLKELELMRKKLSVFKKDSSKMSLRNGSP